MSEITHLTCAHCGGDNIVSNILPQKSMLTLHKTSLVFNCSLCGIHYSLPVIKLETVVPTDLQPCIIELEVKANDRNLYERIISGTKPQGLTAMQYSVIVQKIELENIDIEISKNCNFKVINQKDENTFCTTIVIHNKHVNLIGLFAEMKTYNFSVNTDDRLKSKNFKITLRFDKIDNSVLVEYK